MKKYHIFLVSAAFLFSCSDDLKETVLQDSEIRISTSMSRPVTRTTFHSNLNVKNNSIMVSAYRSGTATEHFTSEALYYDSKWIFCTETMRNVKYYWPDSEAKLDFFAYYPKAADSSAPDPNSYVTIGTYAASHPSFSVVNLPYTSATQTDAVKEFVCAFETGQQQPGSGTGTDPKHLPVGLTFRHPFAKITLVLYNSIRCTINDVSISNICNNGDCVISAIASGDATASGDASAFAQWTPSGSKVTFNAQCGMKYPDQINNGGVIGGPFVVMPQTLGTDVQLTVNYTATGNNKATVVTTTLGGTTGHTPEWKPGYDYTYLLTLNGAANEAILSVRVNPWKYEGDSSVDIK